VFGGGLALWFMAAGFIERQMGAVTGGFGPSGASMDMEEQFAALALAEEMQDLAGAYETDNAGSDDLAYRVGEDGTLIMHSGAEPKTEVPAPVPAAAAISRPAPTLATPVTGRRSANPDWPSLQVDGVIAGKNPSTSSVILDGQIVNVGGTLQGLRVIGVEGDIVEFEYKGERRKVWSGHNTR
jgi:hypothetical protein